jgi:hypothetical protein
MMNQELFDFASAMQVTEPFEGLMREVMLYHAEQGAENLFEAMKLTSAFIHAMSMGSIIGPRVWEILQDEDMNDKVRADAFQLAERFRKSMHVVDGEVTNVE